MHIIGIKIEKGSDPKILKNLRPGWYPFGDYEEPAKENEYKWRKGNHLSDRLYQPFPNMPQISISCVIGMNGSGKTTLFDILFRIINNFSSFIKVGNDIDRYALEFIKGINAKLYFEVDGNIGSIVNTDDTTYLIYLSTNNGNNITINNDRFSDIAKDLFYTIGINYSLYSMNFKEDNISKGNNQWLCNIYNNEAEYSIPLTFSPYRVDGQIDISYEENLANRRLITLSLLLYSQKKELIKGYKPAKICYTLNTNHLKSLKDTVQNLAIRRHVYDSIDDIIKKFRERWEKLIDISKTTYNNNSEVIYDYLANESTRICLTYKGYRDLFDLDDIQQSEDKNDKYAAKKGNYDKIIERLKDPQNKSSITADIRQILSYISRQSISTKNETVSFDDFINRNLPEGKHFFNYFEEAYTILPPRFYDINLFFTKGDNPGDLFSITQLSSGEKQLLYSHSAILYHIYNLANTKSGIIDIAYKHINIVIDEVELYSHPEFQRTYISRLIEMLGRLHISNITIRSINIIIATHSPFVLSDIPKENVLCLENGQRNSLLTETYCANIYDLLKNSFFLEYPMGEVIRKHIDKVVLAYNNEEEKVKGEINNNVEVYYYIREIISDKVLKDTINFMLDSFENEKN